VVCPRVAHRHVIQFMLVLGIIWADALGVLRGQARRRTARAPSASCCSTGTSPGRCLPSTEASAHSSSFEVDAAETNADEIVVQVGETKVESSTNGEAAKCAIVTENAGKMQVLLFLQLGSGALLLKQSASPQVDARQVACVLGFGSGSGPGMYNAAKSKIDADQAVAKKKN
jgi:hypothetical protein